MDREQKDVILNYCVEHGKSPQLSIQFVQIICYMHHRIPLIEEITQFY